jgi:hypothetical protein
MISIRAYFEIFVCPYLDTHILYGWYSGLRSKTVTLIYDLLKFLYPVLSHLQHVMILSPLYTLTSLSSLHHLLGCSSWLLSFKYRSLPQNVITGHLFLLQAHIKWRHL